ncbi:unnamed protein product [Toxocara canis]|uniref:Neur_chan_memb domain-containing protein n=1 Tax=Toxocara canis TaxID=6265 RepID=A0A183US08_TOXCA|nr:unnamed protein product [Toxocara canis]
MLISVAIMIWNERVLSYGRKPPIWVHKLVDNDRDDEEIINKDPAKHPLLQSSKKIVEPTDKRCELTMMLHIIVKHCLIKRRADHDKNVWHRFFSLLDIVSMTSLIVFNTLLTVLTFHSVIFC